MKNSKWFYPLQAQASERLDKMFPNSEIRCQYQVISPDRVVEQYIASSVINGKTKVQEALVVMINNRKPGTLLIYDIQIADN